MKKIICDICGTTYPDTAQQCPICGYANNPAQQGGDVQTADLPQHHTGDSERVRGGRFSAANVRKRNRQTPQSQIQEPEDNDDYFEQEDEHPESNPILVSLLVVMIAALLVVTGIIFFRYYLPNNLPEETTVATEESTMATEESTVPTVPCTSIAITDGIVSVELKNAGDKHLLNVMVLPADTTDELVYSSSNEAVATVNSEGRVTAVGEGEAVITASCGSQSITCSVSCNFTPDDTEPSEEATEQTTEATSETLLDIDLFINYKDVTLSYRGEKLTFKFNEELSAEDIIWTSSKPEVATVENGVVVGVGHGDTVITAQYGDQSVTCIIRCSFW